MLNKNKQITTKHEDVESMKLSYRVIDNTSEDIKGLLIIEDESGIDSIEYTNDEDKLIKLNCNGKLKVAIDKKVKLDKDYNIKIKTNAGERSQTIRIDKAKIEEYVKINLDNDILDIEYNNEETVKKYYKIGNGNWIEYKNKIDITYIRYNTSATISEIYAKEVDKNGNTIINIKQTSITPYRKENVFDIMSKESKTMQEFGFSVVNRVNCENWGFSSHYLCAGHTTGAGNYSAKFKLDFDNVNLNFGKYKSLLIKCVNDVELRGLAGIGNSRVTVYYKNGESEAKQEVNIRLNKTIDIIFNVKNREIDYIEMDLWRI